MNNDRRNWFLLWMCLVLSVFVAVLSFSTGSTWSGIPTTVAAVCAAGAILQYRRRTGTGT